jgi:hypothetical protein
MISRIWHGWTTPQNADAYEELLKHEVFVGIRGRSIPGFQSIQLFRRDVGAEPGSPADAAVASAGVVEVEFVTVMWFDSIDSVRTFAGEDYEVAVVPPAARALLAHFDARSQHYQVKTALQA